MLLAGAACSDAGGGADLAGGPGPSSTTSTTSEATTTAAGRPTSPTTTTRQVAATTTAPGPAPAPGQGGCTVAPGQGPPPAPVAADYATALDFAPDGRLFWAEREGRIKVWQDGEARTFATVRTSTSGERGLLGLAVSPTFASDRHVFAFLSTPTNSRQVVARWTDCGGTGTDVTEVLSLPGGTGCCHKGGRIAFGPDGKLYVTLGDLQSPDASQDTSDPRGKVLRYNADGSVPADNPFGAGNPVWAYGFRNPFGLAVSPGGPVAVTDNGPTGDAGSPSTGHDTVMASVGRGAGYQWPRCYGYSQPLGGSDCGGLREPDWSSGADTVVPTGATFVDASGPAGTAGRLVFCTLGEGMKILSPGSPHAMVTAGASGCRLDVTQGPGGALWFSDATRISRLG